MNQRCVISMWFILRLMPVENSMRDVATHAAGHLPRKSLRILASSCHCRPSPIDTLVGSSSTPPPALGGAAYDAPQQQLHQNVQAVSTAWRNGATETLLALAGTMVQTSGQVLEALECRASAGKD